METKILQKDSPVLRSKARALKHEEIDTKEIQDVISRMKEALYKENDGVAIAAPQIGESVRIFIVRAEAIALSEKRKKNKSADTETKSYQDLIFINPEIIKASKKTFEMEEGCLSVRWLYGDVVRSDKVVIKALNEKGEEVERGASGLMAQIFQHEIDHLNGVLFIDKAKNLREMPPEKQIRYVFLGSSSFSGYVLDELLKAGLPPMLVITSAKTSLPIEELKAIDADVFIVASFGKIIPKEVIEMPKFKTLNVHPSVLPDLRGPSPIQNIILGKSEPGVSIMRLDEKMDHGPIVAQKKVEIQPWPDHYETVEEKLAREGGKLLVEVLPKWVDGAIKEKPQDDSKATYTKMLKSDDALLKLEEDAQENMRKVLAYSSEPGAYINYLNKRGKEIRVVIKDAKVSDGKFNPTRVVPAGKKEMDWESFQRGN